MGRKTTGRLRGVYGRPISKMAGASIDLTPDQISRTADILLEFIKKEIRRDMALSAGIRGKGEAVGLPQTRKFVDSFQVRVKGQSTIEIFSDWPTAEAHTTKLKPNFVDNMRPDRSAPINMTWLRRPEVPYARIELANGEVIVRTTPNPAQGDKYWVHPGFRKYTFIERGLRKGRIAAAEALAPELVAQALSQFDLFG